MMLSEYLTIVSSFLWTKHHRTWRTDRRTDRHTESL